jgi:hypothetical protein
MGRASTAIFVSLMAGVLAGGAGAQPASGPVQTACKPEIERHCAATSAGPELRTCLEEKRGEVSAECRLALETHDPPGCPPGMDCPVQPGQRDQPEKKQ